MDSLDNDLRKHLESNISNAKVQLVLTQRSTFNREVETFYDLNFKEYWTRFGSETIVTLHTENREKRGSLPNDLVDILCPFAPEKMDFESLEYSATRAGVKEWIGGARQGKSFALSAITTFGIFGVPHIFLQGYTYPGVITLSATVLACYHLVSTNNFEKAPKAYQEFSKLKRASIEADKFIDKDFRNYFIDLQLEGMR